MSSFGESCPTPDLLKAHHRGEIGGNLRDEIKLHLSKCGNCESQLSALGEGLDLTSGNRDSKANLEQPSERVVGWPTVADRKTFPACLGKYRLLEEIGRGGMGIVYAAIHTKLNKRVAIKVIQRESALNPGLLARFHREARTVGGLEHDNIISATDADEDDGYHFLVMELVEGLDVEKVVARFRPLPVGVACEIVRQAAVGLQYIHESGRVHRDLKPSNLMLAKDGIVKILDLGLAGIRVSDRPSGELTGIEQAMGTADYMAPEQWRDCHNVDIRADIYSLGCTLFKLLTGKAPFDDPKYALLPHKQIAHGEAARPSCRVARPDVTVELDAIVARMMSSTPSERYATPSAVSVVLHPFADRIECDFLAASLLSSEASLAERIIIPSGETIANQGRTPAQTGMSRQKPSAESDRVTILQVESGDPGPGYVRRHKYVWVGLMFAALGIVGWAMTGRRQEADAAQKNDQTVPEQVGSRAGVWYDLLKDQPIPLYWENRLNDHFMVHNASAREVRVDSPYVSLFELGKTPAMGYRIQLGIRQTQWANGVGLFFGYRVADVEGKQCFKYQLLELDSHRAQGVEEFILNRTWNTLVMRDGLMKMELYHGITSESVGRPTNSHECILEIDVGMHGLRNVSWDGKPLPKLSNLESNSHLEDADYLGSFGTFNRRSASVYGNARVLHFERLTK